MPQVLSAAKAVIQSDGKFLVIKQKVGDQEIWDLPGGRVQFGESPNQTLHREIKEETGLDVDIVCPLGVWWFYRSMSDGDQVVCHTFLCEPQHTDIDITRNNKDPEEEIIEHRWVTKEEFLTNNYLVGDQSLKDLIANAVTV